MSTKLSKIFILSFFLLAIIWVSSMSYGPGAGGLHVTGAPFDNGDCSSCHSGGNYATTVSIQLIKNGNPVSSYIPGTNYILRVSRTVNSIPAPVGFGFQLTCATLTGNTNINNWFPTLPSGLSLRTISIYNGTNFQDRHYIEHNTVLSNSVTQIDIPWTAPNTAGLGSVKFYLSMCTVNGAGSSGDKVDFTSLLVTPSPLSVDALILELKSGINNNILQLSTIEQSALGVYTLQKSIDGVNFDEVSSKTIIGNGHNVYEWIEPKLPFNTFYRVCYADYFQTKQFSPTILSLKSKEEKRLSIILSRSHCNIYCELEDTQKIKLSIWTFDGKCIFQKEWLLSHGNNSINQELQLNQGFYIIQLECSDGRKRTKSMFIS